MTVGHLGPQERVKLLIYIVFNYNSIYILVSLSWCVAGFVFAAERETTPPWLIGEGRALSHASYAGSNPAGGTISTEKAPTSCKESQF